MRSVYINIFNLERSHSQNEVFLEHKKCYSNFKKLWEILLLLRTLSLPLIFLYQTPTTIDMLMCFPLEPRYAYPEHSMKVCGK